MLAAERDASIDKAQVKMAESKLALLRSGFRVEEIAEAKARADAAQQVLDVTRARLKKCEIRSPIDGVVLRKYISEGESAYTIQSRYSRWPAPTDIASAQRLMRRTC
jgi:multidrug resistance efflux pump